MWKHVTNIRNILGLAGLAFLTAYLLSDKLIETGVVGDSTSVAIFLGFLIVFAFGVLLLAVIGMATAKSSQAIRSDVSISGKGNTVKQEQSTGTESSHKQRQDGSVSIEGEDNTVERKQG